MVQFLQVVSTLSPLRKEPRANAPQETQALHGEEVEVFEDKGEWLHVKLLRDGYEGFLQRTTLGEKYGTPNFRVIVPLTDIFPEPNIKTPPVGSLTMGALIVASDEGEFVKLSAGGFLFKKHVRPVDVPFDDYVTVAEQFLNTPYHWGGKSWYGIDCSGLHQLSQFMAGRNILRDSGPQEKTVGDLLSPDTPLEELKRGDLLFWPGHVAIVRGQNSMIHATAYTMQVMIEPIDEAIKRIAQSGTNLRSIKRV